MRAVAICGVAILLWGCRDGGEAQPVDAASSAPDAAVASADAGPHLPREGGDHPSRGTLPHEDIERVVLGGLGAFRSCYEEGLRNEPKLAGRLTVRFVIAPSGAVTNASAAGKLSDATVTQCITKAFDGLAFPKPKGGVVTASCVLDLRHAENTATVDIEWPGH